MQTNTLESDPTQKNYAQCLDSSKRIRWDIEKDVLRGRRLHVAEKFLPDGLSFAARLPFLTPRDALHYSQVQGRTYANLFGLVERFIAAKMLETSRHHFLGSQLALESLVRFADEELKHQELFRRVEKQAADVMPAGYRLVPDPDEVARAVLSKSNWSVLGLTCHIEIFVLAHYKESIAPDSQLSPLWKDVFLHHWKEESQHAILDELEWKAEDERLDADERDNAVDDLIDLVAAVDGILVLQSEADSSYFLSTTHGSYSAPQREEVRKLFLHAYRYQYIFSGVEQERFQRNLFDKITSGQKARILAALASLSSQS